MSAGSHPAEQLQSAAAAASIGTWQIHPGTLHLVPDASACLILGVDGPVDSTVWLASVHPEDASSLQSALLRAQSTGSIELEYRRNSPLTQWIYLKGTAESGIVFDSTARHRMELPIPNSEDHFRQIVEHAREGVWIVDSEGKTVYANPEMASMLRCELHELLGRPAMDFVFDDELPRAIEERDRRNSNSEGQRLEFRYRRADGTELWALVNSSILPGPENSPRLVLGVFADRTAEKELERQRELILAQFAAETELLERIIDTIPVMLIINDPGSNSVRVNREFTRLLGWTTKDVQAGTLVDVCYPDPAERARALEFMNSLTSGWRDFQVTAKDGTIVASSWANIRLSDQRIVGIGIDLRERLTAEQELRESEFRLKLALDAMELGTFDYDLVSHSVTWSSYSKRCFGLSPESPVSFDTIWDAVPPEDVPAITAAVQEATQSGAGRYYVEHRTKGLEDGLDRWVAAWGRVLFNREGAPIRYTGLNLDITERKRAERALAETRASQEILSEVAARLLTTDNPQGIIEDLVSKVLPKTDSDVFFNFLLDRNSGRLHLNSHRGLSPTTVQVAEWLDLGQAVCGLVALEATCRNLSDLLASSDPNTEILRQEGVQAYFCYPLLGGGKVLGTLGFGSRTKKAFAPEDIELFEAVASYVAIALDRMRSREALEESEERYRAIASNIPDGGVWVVDRDFRFIAVEGPLASLFSRGRPSMVGQRLTDIAPPHLAALGMKNYGRAFEGETTFAELEVGGRVLQSQVVPIRDAAGNVAAAMALAFDITSRKQAENALRESEQRERARHRTRSHHGCRARCHLGRA